MNRITLIFSFLYFYLPCFSQTCYDLPSITLSSQAQVDSFPLNHLGITDFYEIIINGTDITHLDSLHQIELCGYLQVRNTSVVNLIGLENLKEGVCPAEYNYIPNIGISIMDNVLLKNLQGINNLKSTSSFILKNNPELESTNDLNIESWIAGPSPYGFGRNIVIDNNSSLSKLEGFDSLKRAGSIYLLNNTLLTDISTFSNLVTISNLDSKNEPQGTFTLKGNPEINSLEAFKNVSVRGITTIENMAGLTSLSSLENLSTRELFIIENPNLEEIELNSLDSYYSYYWPWNRLTISDNPKLENISISNFDFFTPGKIGNNYLIITNNPLLKHCNEEYICSSLLHSFLIYTSINNNAAGCFNSKQIVSQCSLGKNHGIVYLDENCNQIKDSNDNGLENITIENPYGSSLADSRIDGSYGLLYGASLFSPSTINVRDYIGLVSFPENYSYTSYNQENLDFAVCIDSLVSDLRAEITPINTPSVGAENAYRLCVQNNGTMINSGNLILTLKNSDEFMEHMEIIEEDDAHVDDYQFTWSFTDLDFFQKHCFDLKIKIDSELFEADSLEWELLVENNLGTIEHTPEDNIISLSQSIEEIPEPIFKKINPNIIDFNQFINGQDFEFTIEFQNIFNESINNIVIIDTLARAFDLSTFEMVSSSHDYYYSKNYNYITEENVIHWFFDGINLPSAQQDELLSKGQIVFKIKNKTDLAYLDSIQNKAYVKFDCFDQISTNNTKVDYILGNDLSVSMKHTYLDCSHVLFDLEIQNNGVEIADSTSFRFFLNAPSNIDTYNFEEIDGAALVGDTLFWEISQLLSFETKKYSVLIKKESSFYDEATSLIATSIFEIQDDVMENNSDELYLGTFEPDNLWIKNQEFLDNCYCIREIGTLTLGEYDASNDPIINIDSLNQLVSVKNKLEIQYCSELTTIDGFNNLINCKDLFIQSNEKLDSLMGFPSLLEVEKLSLSRNYQMSYFSGFNSLMEISNGFGIYECDHLTSLADFNPPVQNFPKDYFSIRENDYLSICNSPFVCSAIEQDSTSINISNNDEGCANITQVEIACHPEIPDIKVDITKTRLDCSRIEFNINVKNLGVEDSNDITLTFNVNESSISDTYFFEEIDGASLSGDTLMWVMNSVEISETRYFSVIMDISNSFYNDAAELIATANIVDLDYVMTNNTAEVLLGFYQPSTVNIKSQSFLDNCYCLTVIEDELVIGHDSNLDPISNLDSLNNLVSVGDLKISDCLLLKDISGFSKLNYIDQLEVLRNDSLEVISGFNGLDSIQWLVRISNNQSLEDISQCNPSLLSYPNYFILQNNNNLEICNSLFVCSILANESVLVAISNNLSGCNSIKEVDQLCTSSTKSISYNSSNITIYPNPAESIIYIRSDSGKSINGQIQLQELSGKCVISEESASVNNHQIDISHLAAGTYFLTISTDQGSMTEKIVVQ